MAEPAKEKWFSQTINTYKTYWLIWVDIFMKHILSAWHPNIEEKSYKMEATSLLTGT